MNIVQSQLYITNEWITEYAQSIKAPLQILHGRLIAPATMPVIFWQAFDIPWLDLEMSLIHGSQHFAYEQPITAGMLLHCELSLIKVEQKIGRTGPLTFFTHSLVCTCGNALIVTADTVLIKVNGEL